MLVWSYHWWSKYPFVSVPLWEWTYNNPWQALWYCCSYCFEEWNTHLNGGFPPFPLPNPIMNGYSYHQRWLSNFDGRYHCWLDLDRYGVANIDNNNTCSNDDCLRKNTTYVEQTPNDDFILFAIEMYGFLHFHFDSFFITCA
jgi:hypothetical protein